MAMSRKHYEMLATVLRETWQDRINNADWVNAVEQVTRRIAEELEEESERFDAERFLIAAGFAP